MHNSIKNLGNNDYLIGCIVCCILFVLLSVAIIRDTFIVYIDIHLHQYIDNNLQSSFLKNIAFFISLLGDKYVAAPAVVLTGVYLFFRQQKRLALHFIAVIILALVLASVLKNTIAIPRPGVFASPNKYAFPSRHVALCSAYLVFISTIIISQIKRYQWLTVFIVIMIIILQSFSRIILGVHWVSDTIGGFLLGAACGLIGTYHYHLKPMPTQNLTHFFKTLTLFFCLSSLIYLSIFWHELINHYQIK